MRRLRVGSIGSMSAWLPSRRSTEHHSGALSMTWSGQVRSARTIGICGRYLSNGIGLGVTLAGGISGSWGHAADGWVRTVEAGAKNEGPPGREGGGRANAKVCDARPT